MMISSMTPFIGKHCETTATGTLLKFIGIELSEPMLFGLGQGLGFIYWHMKTMGLPFLGGRIQQDLLTKNIASHLGLKVDYKETSSRNTAWENVRTNIDKGIPVGLKLDCYHLDYFTEKVHFAGHYVVIYGYDANDAYVIDAASGSVAKTSLESLAMARSEKGPMASKNLSYTLSKESEESFDIKELLPKAIRSNAVDFLNPPIKNIGYKGIQKAGTEIKKWFTLSSDSENDFSLAASLMEGGGTGGALFRNIYRDFLKEAYALLENDRIKKAHQMYCDIADQWTEIAHLIERAGKTKDISHLNKASDILGSLSTQEKAAMELLQDI